MENTNGSSLSPSQITLAFETLAQPSSPQALIKQADLYISQCESDPGFPLVLMDLLGQVHNLQTRWQVLIHLKHVIKRNWTSKRRTAENIAFGTAVKEQIKARILDCYRQHWKPYYKQFNEIVKYLARQDFPTNYLQLNQFIQNILGSLAAIDIDHILQSEQLLPYLSLVKVVYKEYAERRMLHTVDNYNRYIAGPVGLALSIMQKVDAALAGGSGGSLDLMKKLLQCSRKVDKIVLYCLRCMTSAMQQNQQILQIIKYLLAKLQNLLSHLQTPLQPEAELNILAILQSVTKLQIMFPFAFSAFLGDYLQFVANLLFNYSFVNEKLTCCIIVCNAHPLTTFCYYTEEKQFGESVEAKKGSENTIEMQRKCHGSYRSFYSSENVSSFLYKIVSELMDRHHRSSDDDELIFQDTQTPSLETGEHSSFELLLGLLKNLLVRFRVESKHFLAKIMGHLQSNEPLPQKLALNMYEIILLLPKILDEEEIDVQAIFGLMERCYASGSYEIFCKIIRVYCYFFDANVLAKTFDILVQIVLTEGLGHNTIYQAAACLRRFITNFEDSSLPVQKIGPCMHKLFGLLQVHKQTPNHLWNLLGLLVALLKSVSSQVVMVNLPWISHCVEALLESKDNTMQTLCAVAELIETILNLCDPESYNYMDEKMGFFGATRRMIQRLNGLKPSDEEQEDIKMWRNELWLCLVKAVNKNWCSRSLVGRLVELLTQHKDALITDDPSLFLQLLQQYLLSGTLQLTPSDILSLHSSLIAAADPEHSTRLNTCFFSLYYTHCLMTNNFSQELVLACMEKLIKLSGKISPSLNSLRMELMLVISWNMLAFGVEPVFGVFRQGFPDYKAWFWPYVSSLEYLNNKYASKVTAIALAKALPVLRPILSQQIDENLPFDSVLKFMILYLQPLKPEQALHSYYNSTKMFSHSEVVKNRTRNHARTPGRRARLHVDVTCAEMDLREPVRVELQAIFKEWDWGVDDLEERYSEAVVEQVKRLLIGN